MTIEDVAKQEGFTAHKYWCTYNEYKVYELWYKELEGAIVGFPQFALEKDGVFTLVNDIDETLKIMHHINVLFPTDEE